MGTETTVVFADLAGSSRIFEAMGNARATATVTHLIQMLGNQCEAHGGRVVKTLGDGIFAIFPHSLDAVAAVIELQRGHQKRVVTWPVSLRMELQIGVARGEVVEVDGDFYGDAVNLASRLSGMAGSGQIWAAESVVQDLPEGDFRHRSLGPVTIRGKHEMPVVYRVYWHEDYFSPFLTIPADLPLQVASDLPVSQIELARLGVRSRFKAQEMPIHLGRVKEAQFIISDPRVSRLHARLHLRQGSFVLTDISSYGTWVRFHGNGEVSQELALRREECVLHGEGEISFGAPLSESSSPTITFKTWSGNALPAPQNQ